MKTLSYFRHSLKSGEFISEAGFELITNTHISTKFNQVFSSDYTRAIQTAVTIMAKLSQKHCNMKIVSGLGSGADEILLSDKLIAYFHANPSMDFLEIIRATTPEEQIQKLTNFCGKTIEQCFDQMADGDNALCVGHNPYIGLSASFFSGENARLLKEMQYVIFTQDENGKIAVVQN